MTALWFSKLLSRAIKSNNMKKMTASNLGIHGKDVQGRPLGRRLGEFMILEDAILLLCSDAQKEARLLFGLSPQDTQSVQTTNRTGKELQTGEDESNPHESNTQRSEASQPTQTSQTSSVACIFEPQHSIREQAEKVYWKLPQVQPNDDFWIVDWWRQMGHLMPKLAGIARPTLAVPATGCDVERAFSSLKWVKDERQRGMHEESRIAAVLLHFNGVVPS